MPAEWQSSGGVCRPGAPIPGVSHLALWKRLAQGHKLFNMLAELVRMSEARIVPF